MRAVSTRGSSDRTPQSAKSGGAAYLLVELRQLVLGAFLDRHSESLWLYCVAVRGRICGEVVGVVEIWLCW
jgi:hypothetical protein